MNLSFDPSARSRFPLKRMSCSDAKTKPPLLKKLCFGFTGKENQLSSKIEQIDNQREKNPLTNSKVFNISLEENVKRANKKGTRTLFFSLNKSCKKVFEQTKEDFTPVTSKAFGQESPSSRSTRLFLPTEEGNSLDIHANMISMPMQKKWVAAQSPYFDCEKTMQTFWQICKAYQINRIVDLTNEEDHLGSNRYPSEIGQEKTYGTVQVVLEDFSKIEMYGSPIYEEYKYRVKEATGSYSISRFHFPFWLDQTSLNLDEFKHLVNQVSLFDDSHNGILVHCKQGFGRTGTLLMGVKILKLFQIRELTKENACSKIIEMIKLARQERCLFFVSTTEQFHLLFEYAALLIFEREEETESPQTLQSILHEILLAA